MLSTQAVALILGTLLLRSSANAADTYTVDTAYSTISFSVRHLGINSIKGQFKEFAGSLMVDKGVLKEASIMIQVQSLDTGLQQRDDHLRGGDFFDTAKYSTITFKSKHIRAIRVYARHKLADGRVTIVGDFTMHGVTKELRLPAKMTGPVTDPSGNVRMGLEAKMTLKRKDYGIAFQQVLETGALLLGEVVTLEINAEAIRDTAGMRRTLKSGVF